MRYKKLQTVIEKYKNREHEAVQNIIRTKGVECKIHRLKRDDALCGMETKKIHNTDPIKLDVPFLDHQYAQNDLDLEREPDFGKIFFLPREEDHYIDSSFELLESRSASSLRNDYIAYISSICYVGEVITIDSLEDAKYIIHRVFRHREHSDVLRYLLSREY